MKPKHKRLSFVVVGLALLAAAVGLIVNAFEDNIVFFFGPSEVLAEPPAPDRRLRIGGLVEAGSVQREGTRVRFRVTDLVASIPVVYEGLLPDLFREGQGVVAGGHLRGGVFHADEVLAKHDENYMPPEVAETLKKSGRWQDMEKTLRESGHIGEGRGR